MTTKSEYNAEEWQLLLDVPTLAGLAVMMSAKSGLGTMKEAISLTRSTLEGGKEFPNVELIQAIVNARLKGGEKSTAETFTDNPYQGLGIEKFKAAVSEKCRAASEVLARKATPEEAVAFRTWVLSIADNVSKAAYEGGFLGFGGTQVSPEEVAAIDSIKAALA
ncbi:MAG: hypothetical protein RKP20_09940 [Candidatus Competibacter sp.]|uniref:Uncharacterized protein n=1 Tax=Candidatus Defluviicoccus seviourii TaxID=2565273 RepID=A0A564W9R6_9PROT|nr:hypothetical protein [Defluviicoccus sp.]MDS4041485.1 hypothetical protein [Candidatus Competibacter sp.]VUX45189.1 conserved hypothetical protein [Candidatus Defluviicoccus seviourii]HRW60138.1 hypothetical protein [Defluviicoccus sp.]